MDWTDFFTGISSAGASIATAVIGPRVPLALPGSPGSYFLPSGATGQIVNSGGLLGTGSSSTLLILLGAVVLIFAMRR
jgi:hypothetical protein